jgi:hypothetical protein
VPPRTPPGLTTKVPVRAIEPPPAVHASTSTPKPSSGPIHNFKTGEGAGAGVGWGGGGGGDGFGGLLESFGHRVGGPVVVVSHSGEEEGGGGGDGGVASMSGGKGGGEGEGQERGRGGGHERGRHQRGAGGVATTSFSPSSHGEALDGTNGINSQKVLSTVTLCSKYTGTLASENFRQDMVVSECELTELNHTNKHTRALTLENS